MPRYFITTLGVLVVVVTLMSVPIGFKYPAYITLGILIAVASYYEKRPRKKVVYRVPTKRRKETSVLGNVVQAEIQVPVSANSPKVFESGPSTTHREEI